MVESRTDIDSTEQMRTQIVRLSQLAPELRIQMFKLMSKYYKHIEASDFNKDLNEKSKVILLWDRENKLQGFSTILEKEIVIDSKKIMAIFSGDTVLEKEHWGNGALAAAFGRFIIISKLLQPFTAHYWFLISKGYKTYLLMTNNFPVHYPRYEKPLDHFAKKLMDTFYTHKFGPLYDSKRGVILASDHAVALKESITDITADLLGHSRISFFAKMNPGWHKGEELCCVARVSLSVPFYYFIKFFRKKMARPPAAVFVTRR